MEHLNEADKAKARAPRTALQSFLGIAEQQQQQESSSLNTTVIILTYYSFYKYFFNC